MSSMEKPSSLAAQPQVWHVCGMSAEGACVVLGVRVEQKLAMMMDGAPERLRRVILRRVVRRERARQAEHCPYGVLVSARARNTS